MHLKCPEFMPPTRYNEQLKSGQAEDPMLAILRIDDDIEGRGQTFGFHHLPLLDSPAREVQQLIA